MQENIKGDCTRLLKPKMPVLTDVFRWHIVYGNLLPSGLQSQTAQSGKLHFFRTAAAAEQAGYRPCLLCRPELAPGPLLLMLRLI